jgi:hypothetical protein
LKRLPLIAISAAGLFAATALASFANPSGRVPTKDNWPTRNPGLNDTKAGPTSGEIIGETNVIDVEILNIDHVDNTNSPNGCGTPDGTPHCPAVGKPSPRDSLVTYSSRLQSLDESR